jgi:hypothetical protein
VRVTAAGFGAQQASVALSGLGFTSLAVAALVMLYAIFMFRLRASRIHVRPAAAMHGTSLALSSMIE